MFTHLMTAVPEGGDTRADDEPEDAGRTVEVVGIESVGMHVSPRK